MQVYDAPLRDMRFVLHELHADDGFGGLQALEEFSPELIDQVLEEANRFARDVLLPINRTGDEEGCRLENGVVRTPTGFKQAYDAFRESGWTAIAGDPAHGGQGLPEGVNKMVEEMTSSCNVAFGLYPGLSHGAAIAIAAMASDELKERYLGKITDGTWAGTMCLTEAHCGTDLGLLRTRATPRDDGSYTLDGAKIFISGGDHDLTENIVHLVLARLPEAPKGVKGISLFLVPKYVPNADGSLGNANGVTCTALEHKMGIHGTSTCQLSFDGAQGWLVGRPNKGMEGMFKMMNSERLSVGIQGLGLGEAAYQAAVYYAKDRVQGRSLSGAKQPDKAADSIIVHPDVRRMLMTMRAWNEGCRALGAWVARALDAERFSPDPEVRQRAADFVQLMTPVVKALFTDLGFESTNLAVQVYGGHGYIAESGVEQYVRDARIAMIYEGTNGIQALDLVGRKLPAHMGRYLRAFFHPVSNFLADHAAAADKDLAKMVEGMTQAFGALQLSTATIAERGLKDPEEAGAAATDYLRLLGLVALGYCFAKSAELALARIAAEDAEADFYRTKLATARFFFDRLLPQATACFLAIKSGKAAMMALDEAAF